MSEPQSRLDKEPLFSDIKARVLRGETNATIAQECDVHPDAVRRFRKRHGLNPDQVTGNSAYIDEETGTGSFSVRGILTDPDSMLRERGLNPAEWEITSLKANEWDGPSQEGKVTYYQTSFNVRKRMNPDLIRAARSDGWKATKKWIMPKSGEEKLVVFVGDQQAPFHDKRLHEKFCSWLNDWNPHEGVLIGDTVDFPDVSRHRFNPERNATLNECIQGGYDLLRDYIDSAPGTRWKKLPGNHDERIRNAVLDQLRELYGVRRAITPEDRSETSVLGVEHLLRLDELGIEYVDPNGEYAQGQIKVTKNLAARHGWIAKKGAGASALATLEHLGFSVVIGHTHRQSLVHKTTHDINGEPETLAAAEIGCMAQIAGGLGYAVSPDWQNGFATATIWPDGFFKIDLATYVNDTLLWRDVRY